MSRSDVESDFPGLIGKQYDLSPEDFNYNCLSFALGDYSQWWEPPKGPGQYWPPGFSDDTTVETVEAIIRLHGFTVEIMPNEKPSSDAIAIYATSNHWRHFAKFSHGVWSSKLGDGNDVSGVTLQDLEMPIYGKVVKVLCRPLPLSEASTVDL
jgi:hypothetical protein